MAFFRFGGSRHEFDDEPRRFFGGGGGGGGGAFGGPGGRFGGPGKGRRDKQGGKPTRRGVRGGKNRDDKKGGGGKPMGGKRRHPGGYEPNAKKLKPGNNWHGIDRHPLMQAPPMESKPENFEDEWLLIIRPMGRRRIVVGANNITQSYNNASDPDMKFESCLPSGNCEKDEMFKQQDLCILDAIYSPEKKEFYVVDMLHWRHYPYYDNEADFRFFCLEDKWTQLKDPGEKWSLNDYPLMLLNRYSCSSEKIEEALRSFSYKVDDLLFMKKTSLYNPEEATDCLKLKLDKVKDVLGIDVPEEVIKKRNESKKGEKKEEKKENDGSAESEIKEEDQNTTEDKSNGSPNSASAGAADNQMEDGNEGKNEESRNDSGKEEEEKAMDEES